MPDLPLKIGDHGDQDLIYNRGWKVLRRKNKTMCNTNTKLTIMERLPAPPPLKRGDYGDQDRIHRGLIVFRVSKKNEVQLQQTMMET